ncbi:MAG: hypothetical protein AAFX79_04670 [Planctomycetota bacterium]
MLLFVPYALLVWYGACRWRRRWLGVACVAVGELGILGFMLLHTQMNAWVSYDMYLPVLQFLLWGYLILIGLVGFFVVAIPHRPAAWCCQKCGYDLTGVPGFAEQCPECGVEYDRATAEAAERRAAAVVERPAAAESRSRDVREILGRSRLGQAESGRSAAELPDATNDEH